MDFFTKFFATGFGIGYVPKAPGTFATFLAAAIWWYSAANIFFIVAVLFFLVAIFVCGKAEKLFGIKDDQRIVIDEFIGYFVSVVALPKTYLFLVISIILFRFFDVQKPFFIKSVQRIKGSVGILADDVLSGIMARVILQIILLL